MFVPRSTFPDIVRTTWYPGHMSAALREIQQLIQSTDLLIEVRDARIPLSSRNPQFAPILQLRPRIVVYNKLDLAGLSAADCRVIAAWDQGSTVLFGNAKDGGASSSRNLLQTIKQKIRHAGQLSVKGARILVIGMPNVGKSTVLNALRHTSLGRRKAAKTGAQPGITRSTASHFKVLDDPLAYIVDTPGIMVPFVPNPRTMLKLGLVHSVKDAIVDPVTLADYLLFELNLRGSPYVPRYKTLAATNDIAALLEAIGQRTGALQKGGTVDVGAAARTFIQHYRTGKFGGMCLDAVVPLALERRIEEEGAYLSKSQLRRGITPKSA